MNYSREGQNSLRLEGLFLPELEGFGVDLTETFLTRLSAVLTEDQMSALRKKAEALKANGCDLSQDLQRDTRRIGCYGD